MTIDTTAVASYTVTHRQQTYSKFSSLSTEQMQEEGLALLELATESVTLVLVLVLGLGLAILAWIILSFGSGLAYEALALAPIILAQDYPLLSPALCLLKLIWQPCCHHSVSVLAEPLSLHVLLLVENAHRLLT